MSDGQLDRAVTTVTDDGSFRVVTVCTTRTVAGAIRAQNVKGSTAEHLADLITGSVLVRLTMAPDLRVQSMVRGRNGKGTIVADSHADGGCRGLVRETTQPIAIGPGSLLQMMRSLPNGTLHQGVVEVPVDYGISGALMVYMLESEQVTSVIGVGCTLDDNDRVEVAGGWIIQLLPECTEPPIDQMYSRMRAEFADIKAVLRANRADPHSLQREILASFPFRETSSAEIMHRCYCSATRVFASLAALGQSDIADILEKGETLFINCDYCGRPYEVSPEKLRGLVEAS